MALTKSVQSAVMHAVMKHAGGGKKKHKKAEAKKEPKEVKGVPDDGDDDEYMDEKPEAEYSKYREPKKKEKK